MKIAVAGMGYVGLSNAVLLAHHNEVTAVDILQEKADLVNSGKSPIVDKELEEYLRRGGLKLHAVTRYGDSVTVIAIFSARFVDMSPILSICIALSSR